MREPIAVSEVDAIRRVLAEGQAMDYVDVVRAVKGRFGLDVSAGLVEQVYLKEKQVAHQQPQPRIDVEIHPSSSLPETEGPPARHDRPAPEGDPLAHALQFVKSVGGLRQAKLALQQLEQVLETLKD